MNATEELVAIPPTPAADLVGQIMERVAIPAAVEKLASAGYLDHLPAIGSTGGRAFRDLDWEQRIFQLACN